MHLIDVNLKKNIVPDLFSESEIYRRLDKKPIVIFVPILDKILLLANYNDN